MALNRRQRTVLVLGVFCLLAVSVYPRFVRVGFSPFFDNSYEVLGHRLAWQWNRTDWIDYISVERPDFGWLTLNWIALVTGTAVGIRLFRNAAGGHTENVGEEPGA